MRTTHAARFIALGATTVAILSAFLLLVRPWYLHWGATDEEARRSLPGDGIIPNAVGQGTRAITIRAPVERVWPWLAQLGQDRGGFYSYDLLENLVGCEMPTIDRLDPEKQAWRPGDKLWMYPQHKAGGAVRNHVQVGLWTVAFGLFISCVVMVLADRRWRQSLIAVATAAIVFQILTLGQPAIPMSAALLTAAVVAVAWWPPRRKAGANP